MEIVTEDYAVQSDRSSQNKCNDIENIIFTIRGVQVILDKDLADLYGIQTFRLNEQVKRNAARFPETFRFRLTHVEVHELIANCDRLSNLKHSSMPPFVFTEQGVAMLSAVLKSETAVQISIKIIDAFVAMRRFLLSNAQVFNRLERLEYRESVVENKIEVLFKRIEEKTVNPRQGLFYEGQIFDAYKFVCDLIRSATYRVILIDNYIDDTVLAMLDKRQDGVAAKVFTQSVSNQLKVDITKHNQQYPAIDVYVFKKSHDRFMIVDDSVYLIGASLKDLGKKWFGITKMIATIPEEMLDRLIPDAVDSIYLPESR